MGGFCTPSYTALPDAGETVEGTEIPAWVAAAGREIFNSATGIAGSPYPNYTGERVELCPICEQSVWSRRHFRSGL